MKRELDDCRLYLLFTPALCRGDPWAVLQGALEAGVDLVQWRPAADPRLTEADGTRCAGVCKAHHTPLIVNDDPSLAARIDAAGAHVGQGDATPAVARRLLGPGRWLGVSTHDAEQARAATAAGADYLGFGPCYPTATKGYARGQDPAAIAEAVRATPLPVFGIGGIIPARVAPLARVGCRRIAVSSFVLAADDPGAAVAALRQALDGATTDLDPPYNSKQASPNE